MFYIVQTIADVSLKLQYTGSVAAEPEPFKKMAHSLKLLGETGAPPAKIIPGK